SQLRTISTMRLRPSCSTLHEVQASMASQEFRSAKGGLCGRCFLLPGRSWKRLHVARHCSGGRMPRTQRTTINATSYDTRSYRYCERSIPTSTRPSPTHSSAFVGHADLPVHTFATSAFATCTMTVHM